MAGRERTSTIVVKARSEGLDQVQSKMSKLLAAQAKTSARRDANKAAADNMAKLRAEVDRATISYQKLSDWRARQAKLAKRLNRDLYGSDEFKQQIVHMRAAKAALTERQAALQKATNAERASAATSSAAWKARADAARDSLMLRTASQRQLTDATDMNVIATGRNTRATVGQSKADRDAAAAASRHAAANKGLAASQTAAWGTTKGRGALGLRPYELTNLTYQINDVVSGLAMGQRPMQVFTQQAGQIIQIFPKMMTGLLRLLPVLGLVGAGFLLVARNARMGKDIEEFETQLTFMGESAVYSAERLAELARAEDQAGLSATVAKDAVLAFVKTGMDTRDISKFIAMAKQLAKVTGESVPDAVDKLASAFDRGVDGVVELDKEINFLTASQYENIRALEKSGRETDALRVAQDSLADRLQATADKSGAGGNWSMAAEHLGNSWGTFMDWMSQTWLVDQMSKSLLGLALGAEALAGMLPGTGGAGPTGATSGLMPVATEGAGGDVSLAESRANAVAAEYEELGEIIRNGEEFIAQQAGYENVYGTGGVAAERMARVRAEIDAAGVAQQQILSDLMRGVPAAEEVALASERRAEADAAAAADAELLGKTLVDQNIAYNDQLGALDESARLSAMGAEDRYVELEVLKERNNALRIANEAGVEFVELGKEDLDVLRERARLAYAAANPDKPSGGGSPEDREKEIMAGVDALLAYKSELENLLEVQREIGDTEGVAITEGKVEELNVELLAAIDNAMTLWAAVGGTAADEAITKLAAIKAGITNVGQVSIMTGEEMNEGLAGVGVGALDGLAKAIANGEDAGAAFFNAFRQGAADFLLQIAQMIMQQALLNALQGGGGAGGGVGGILAGGINALFHHDGGVAGTNGTSKSVPMAAFAGAGRFHSGGLPGLKSNEVAAVLEKGEEVLTADDSRHVANGGGSQGDLKIVFANTSASVLREGVKSQDGGDVMIEWVQENSASIRGALGV